MSRGAQAPGRVALVGGGPGPLDLLTVRAVRLLGEADVVVHDRLGPGQDVAALAPGATLVDVGKVPGDHPVPQEAINRLLVGFALAGRRVVRLKGGDPYVFGRGGEEVLACREAGVPVEVVPGVTSAVSVPAAAGIPVTHRGLARSVTVLTGHEVADPARLAGAVALGGTLVVLMGVAQLDGLVAGLLAAGQDPATPAAVVEQGWTPQQRTTTAPLAGLAAAARARAVASPAVVVVGAVAALADDPTARRTVDSPVSDTVPATG